MKKFILLQFILLQFTYVLLSQDINYAHQVIDTLCSPSLQGRGYTFGADQKAANYIENELKKAGVQYFGDSYRQPFDLDVNIFDDKMQVKIGKNKLSAGKDFVLDPSSCSANSKYTVVWLDAEILNDEQKYISFLSTNHSKHFVAIDTAGTKNESFKKNYRKFLKNKDLNAAGIITFADRPIFSISQHQTDYVHIIMLSKFADKRFKKIKVTIDAKQIKNYETNNLISYIKGQVDTFVVVTAHYDHVGTLGKDVFFPGAHDNASGCALVLDLIEEFSQRKSIPYYGIIFIFFSGEEIGLLGSKFFVENPLIDLKKIKFLINYDIVGSGDKGIQIVNSTIFKDEYNKILEINKKYNYLPVIKKRGAAANSDHYFFYAAGVPCFYIYSLGEYKEYHNIYDTRENLPLSKYQGIFRLSNNFITYLVDKYY